MSHESDEGFLSRWSRRKRAGGDAPKPDAVGGEGHAGAPAADEPFDVSSLPKLEDLTGDADFKAFLQKGVPDALRQQALRKAWSLDPRIRDFIEMAENQYDWNVPDGVPGFGELAADTNIEQLLAQATGALQPEDQKPELAADTASQTEAERPENDAAAPVDAEVLPPMIADTPGVEVAEPGAQRALLAGADFIDDKAVSAADAPVQPRRRRHGGALPQV